VTLISDATLEHLSKVADLPDLDAGRYEVVEKIGQGGMGSVYLARDLALDRMVALKVLASTPADESAISRFRTEARILGRLEHPGIVPVHDVGQLPDGRMFYAMKLVKGKRLDALVAEPILDLLRIFERICEAVSFAHAYGVIHRDLKPENIMVGAFGEVLVMDWGVAKLRAEKAAAPSAEQAPGSSVPGQTSPGTVLGTPAYMAPEQRRGDIGQIDERTDVYGLGAILYFLQTGKNPAEAAADKGAHVNLTLAGDRYHKIARPRLLSAICAKALAADPDDRYSGARDLAADINRFLAGDSVVAYPEGLLDAIARWCSKYRTAIILVLAYLAMRLVLFFFSKP
jgi:serine/threonine protein kinase